MVLLVYLLIVFIALLYIMGRMRYARFIRHINKKHTQHKDLPILAYGKFIKAFTIERGEMLTISTTYAMDYMSYFFLVIGRLLRLDLFFTFGDFREILAKKAYADLCEKAESATYIVDYREQYNIVGGRIYHLTVTCNALYMYPDTLPLLHVEKANPALGKLGYAEAIRPMIVAAIFTACTFFLISYFAAVLSARIVTSLPVEREQIFWSYIADSVKKDEVTRSDLIEARSKLQAILDELQLQVPDKRYYYELLITNDEQIDIVIYPAGKIVFTKGFIEKLQTKYQAAYVFAHIIGHAENKDHLSELGDTIVTLDFIATVFGEDSGIGRLMAWRSDFEEDYTLPQELHADEFALSLLYHVYGKIGGLDIFEQSFYDLTNAYVKIFNTHPFDIERVAYITQFIAEQGYEFADSEKLNLIIEDAAEPSKLSNVQVENNDKFMDLFYNYRADTNEVYKRYQEFLKQFNHITHLHGAITITELRHRKDLIEKGLVEMPLYKAQFNKIFDGYESQFERLLQEVPDASQKKVIVGMWNNEFNQVKVLTNFYLKRDSNLLQNQLIIVQFLSSRYGSYKVTKSGVEFQTEKEKSDYIHLQRRVEAIIKTPPPKIQ